MPDDISTRWKLGMLAFNAKLQRGLTLTIPNFYESLAIFIKHNYIERFNELDIHIVLTRKGKKVEYQVIQNGEIKHNGKV